jgi:hypothetical protein
MAAVVLCLAAMTAVAIPPAPAATGNIAPAAARSPARGYWLAAADGGIFAFGDAGFFGSTGNIRLNRPIVGMTPTATGGGYWLTASDGGIFAFGDARFQGSTGNITLAKPVVGMAATPSGGGYWLVASDGGIFAFGDARFLGSTGNIRLAQPIVGMAATATGKGYWLLARDGGVFAFGDARFLGAAAEANLTFAAMGATPSGHDYWLASRDDRTYAFGDALDLGSVPRVRSPIVGIAPTPSGSGAWLVGSDGGIFSFGDARFHGSTGNIDLNQPIVTGAAAVETALSTGSVAYEPPAGALAPAVPAPPGASAPAAPPPSGAYTVGLLGDTGYTDEQDQTLLVVRDRMAARNLAFVVHDGDIQAEATPCVDSRLEYLRGVFDGFASPLIFVPGDNEWFDCHDPRERLEAIRRVFHSTSESMGRTRLSMERQATWIENARWHWGGVMFVTLNLPGHTGATVPGAVLIEWLNGAFDAALASNAPATMVIWHDDPIADGTNQDVLAVLKARAAAFGRPVILVHGDTHVHRIDKPWDDVPNLTRVETFADGSDSWVEIRVDPATPTVFTVSAQH